MNDVEQVRRGRLLKNGAHTPTGDDPEKCDICVEEMRYLACEVKRLGFEFDSPRDATWWGKWGEIKRGWSDHPGSRFKTATHLICIGINDARWSSDEARTKYCLPLALLSEADAPEGWLNVVVAGYICEILPILLRANAANPLNAKHKDTLEAAAKACEEGPEGAALAARADLAALAARAARAALADLAARAARAALADLAARAARAALADLAALAALAGLAGDKILAHIGRIVLTAHGRADLIVEWDEVTA